MVNDHFKFDFKMLKIIKRKFIQKGLYVRFPNPQKLVFIEDTCFNYYFINW